MKTDNRQKLLIVLTVAAGTLLLGDRLIYSPLVHWWQARDKEISRLTLQVKEGRALVNHERSIRDRWDSMQTNTLPNNPSLAQEKVLKAFQEWAQESGVSLNGITPQWKGEEEHQTLVCRVDASGTLWMLTRFIYDIEKGPLGLKLESVEINSRDNTGQQLALGLQVSGLVLVTQNP